MMSYEEFTQKEAALESAPQAEREAFYAEILEKETAKTDVRMMAYFHAALLHYREGDFRAAREILEPFVIDYQSYAYRPEIIACFNLMGVAVYCERSYALARFYIHEGLKIARENHEISRYSYEYNNLAVTYLAQYEYEKALEAIREAERHLPDSDREMHAYVYRNLSEICCHLDRLDEAQAALLESFADTLNLIFITSQASVVRGEAPEGAYTDPDTGVSVLVEPADGRKCDRCWTFVTDGTEVGDGYLCPRCRRVVGC